MIRAVYFAVILGILVLGTGVFASDALSEIFLRPGNGETTQNDQPQKPSLYIRPDADVAQDYRVKLTKGLATKRLVNTLQQDLKTLEAWKSVGRPPQTKEELISFGQAHRAMNTLKILKRREAATAFLEKAREARAQKQEAKMMAQMLDNPEEARAKTVKMPAAQKRTIYINKEKTQKKPQRVFRNYR